MDFNPRSPCGERLRCACVCGLINKFQSTLPVRGATDELEATLAAEYISIHAPRAGSDRAKR